MNKRARINAGKWLLLILFVSFILFSPSLFTFYTHDDFFLIKISNIDTITEFINFFNLKRGPEGLGVYRPLTTQVFYFLGHALFDKSAMGLHIISFLAFFLTIILVYKLVCRLTNNKDIAAISAFLYAVSSTHFGHLYYLATFQELGLAVFYFMSSIFFIDYLKSRNRKYYFLSFISFLLALVSKETALVIPFTHLLIFFFLKFKKESNSKLRNVILLLAPYFLIIITYFYFRIFHYGFAKGESYIWDFSSRAINTLLWYGLWSLNLPEMLVDFVGPGFKLNPKLFRFWAGDIVPIFTLFTSISIFFVYLVLRIIKKLKNSTSVFAFSFFWFLFTLVPVIFLPLHKFTFYLTVPLFAVVLLISTLLYKAKIKKFLLFLFLSIWLSLSILTLKLTHKTHWITQGAKVALSVHEYFKNTDFLDKEKKVVFYDTEKDSELPWSPTDLLKVVLSDNNYFEAYNIGVYAVYDREGGQDEGAMRIKARRFLPY